MHAIEVDASKQKSVRRSIYSGRGTFQFCEGSRLTNPYQNFRWTRRTRVGQPRLNPTGQNCPQQLVNRSSSAVWQTLDRRELAEKQALQPTGSFHRLACVEIGLAAESLKAKARLAPARAATMGS